MIYFIDPEDEQYYPNSSPPDPSEQVTTNEKIKFVLISNAWQNRLVHVQSLDGRNVTLCGYFYYKSWSKSDIPTANFCSRCEKSLNKIGYQVDVFKITKTEEIK